MGDITPGGRRSLALIEDNADLAFLLSRAFRRSEAFEVVGTATDIEAGAVLLSDTAPEVVVVDARLPGQSDLVMVPLARRCCPEALIVVLTALSSERMKAEAQTAGADFVVEKNTSPNRMVANIVRLVGE